MIIFLYGPDAYRRRQKLNEILSVYRQKHSDWNSEFFDLAVSAEEFLKLKNFLNAQSLFEDFKLAVISGLYEAEPRKDLAALIKGFLENRRTIIFISENEAPVQEFKFLLKPPVKSQEFKELKGAAFKVFLKKEAAFKNLKLSPAAERFLTETFNPDTWGLINELEKLSLVSEGQPIEISQLKFLGDFGVKEKLFDLVKTMIQRQPLKMKLVNLEQLFLQKEAAPHIFNLLAAIAPQNLIEKLADYDSSIKSGGLDYEEALLDLVLN